MRLRTLLLLFLSFVLFVSFFQFQKVAASDTPIAGGAAVGVQEGYGNLPLVFEANQGQTDAEVKFLSPVLSYSTYLGGSGQESNEKIAVDAAGNAYVAGCTDSVDFPTNKAIQPVLGGGSDLFVTKINASGTALVYSTYLGGTGDGVLPVSRWTRRATRMYWGTMAGSQRSIRMEVGSFTPPT